MIEVWEHLDCETVGARELEAVADAVRERFGEGAVEGPAVVARLLADEGAELRHAEVLDADARWRTQDPYEAMFRNVLKFSTSARPRSPSDASTTCVGSSSARATVRGCASCARPCSRASAAHR